MHICPERVLACVSFSSGKNSNRAVQDPRFLFMERFVTVKAVSIHVVNETRVIWFFLEKGKRYLQEAG